MTKDGKMRIQQIDIARGFAAICMILGHSFIVYPIDISQVWWCRALHIWIYSFHMELFFFLVGAVWYCNDFKMYVIRKSKRVLVPYVVFGLLSITIRVFGTSLVNNNESLKDGLLNFVIGGGGYWFLYVLFLMYLVFPLMDFIAKKMKSPDEWLIIVSVVLMVMSSVIRLPTFMMIDSIVYYLPFFLMGRYLVGIKKVYLMNVKMSMVGILTIVGGIVYFTLLVLTINIAVVTQIRAFAMIVVIIGLIEIVMGIKDIHKGKLIDCITRPINECGKYTLQLYLFNGYLLVIIRTLLVNVLKIYNPVLIVSVITVGNLVITVFFCKKIIPKLPIVRGLCGL